jgi:hypothetical protein
MGDKVHSQLRERFYWFYVKTDVEYPDYMYKLPSPTLVKRWEDDYGVAEIYMLSAKQYLYRHTYENGRQASCFIGIELYDGENHHVYAEYVYYLPVDDNDYLRFIDLEEYHRIYADNETNEEEKITNN